MLRLKIHMLEMDKENKQHTSFLHDLAEWLYIRGFNQEVLDEADNLDILEVWRED